MSSTKIEKFKNDFDILFLTLSEDETREILNFVQERCLMQLEVYEKNREDRKDEDYMCRYCNFRSHPVPDSDQKNLREVIREGDLKKCVNMMNTVEKDYNRRMMIMYGLYKSLQYEQKEIVLYFLPEILESEGYDGILDIILTSKCSQEYTSYVYDDLCKREKFKGSRTDKYFQEYISTGNLQEEDSD